MKCKWWLSLVCLVWMLACSCALAENVPGDVFDLEWYQTPQTQQENAAHLNFFLRYSPVKISHIAGNESLPYRWDIWYGYENLGTADFTPTQVTEVFFDENGEVADVFVTNGIGLNLFFPNETFKAGDVKGYNIMRPAGSETGYGAAFRGTDSNGNEQVFGVYVPLSQEVEIRYTLDYFKTASEPEEGKAFIAMTPREAVAPLVQNDRFSKGEGWYYGFHAARESDVAFTVRDLVEVIFDHNGDAYPNVFSVEQLQSWGWDLTFPKGEAQHFGGSFPIQNAQAVGFVLRGVDENGNELSFHTFVELEQKQ